MKSNISVPSWTLRHLSVVFFSVGASAMRKMGTPTELSAEEHEFAAADRKVTDANSNYMQMVDIMDSTGIHFDHNSSPKKFLSESMSGGAVPIDCDLDGWRDICFTSTQSARIPSHGVKVHIALSCNSRCGTFEDARQVAGVVSPKLAKMGETAGP